jgi:hypothetical protein
MKRYTLFLLLVACLCLNVTARTQPVRAEPGLSFAILPVRVEDGVGGYDEAGVRAGLADGLSGMAGRVVPASQIAVIVPTAADLDFNPTVEAAATLGAKLGSEYYVTGRVVRREESGSDRQTGRVARTVLFLVAARTGELVATVSNVVRRETADELGRAERTAAAETARELYRLAADHQRAFLANATDPDAPIFEAALDLRSGDVPPEVILPVIFQRPKPAPTETAKDFGIEATVTAEIVFQADGKIGGFRVVRWAGYGLEDAVRDAVRRYRFKPAQRGGKPVAVRLIAEFKFRTVRADPAQE